MGTIKPNGIPLTWITGPKGLQPGLLYLAEPKAAGSDDSKTYAEYCGHFHKQEGKMNTEHSLKFFFDDLIPKERALAHFFTDSNKERYAVNRILKSGPCTHVFWADGTKTTVRRSPDEPDNDYAAFTAALAIKIYGSNSALKRMLKEKVEVQKLKKKSTKCTDTCPIDFEAIDKNLQAEKERLNELSEKSHGLTNDA